MRLILALLLVVAHAAACRAQEEFYKGKTLRIVISTGVAGGFAEYARLISEQIGKHIAGQPHVIVQSMPGAGGLLAANYLYTQAPQDGTTIGIINSTVPLAPLWGSKGARFETSKFNWLGALDRAEGVCTLWHTSPVKTWSDMLTREHTVGSIGAGSEMELYPAALNKLFGTKIKVIASSAGFEGAVGFSSPDFFLADMGTQLHRARPVAGRAQNAGNIAICKGRDVISAARSRAVAGRGPRATA